MGRLPKVLGTSLLFFGSVGALAQAPVWRLEVAVPPELDQVAQQRPLWQRWLGARRAGILFPKPGTKFTVNSSAYASSPYQTDSTPCVTAAGTRVRPGVVATNFLPFGTLLSINGRLFIVEDRMNGRFNGKYLDVWFPSTSEALDFGRKPVQVEVVGYGTPGQELTEEDQKLWERAKLRFIAVSRTVSGWLTVAVRKEADVNQYDVDCLHEDQ